MLKELRCVERDREAGCSVWEASSLPHTVLQVAVGGPGPLALAQGTGAKTCTSHLRKPESPGTV